MSARICLLRHLQYSRCSISNIFLKWCWMIFMITMDLLLVLQVSWQIVSIFVGRSRRDRISVEICSQCLMASSMGLRFATPHVWMCEPNGLTTVVVLRNCGWFLATCESLLWITNSWLSSRTEALGNVGTIFNAHRAPDMLDSPMLR